MSSSAATLRAVGAVLAVLGIGSLIWWFAIGADAADDTATSPDTSVPATETVPATTDPTAAATPEPTATPTPLPTPTPVPTPLPFVEAVPLGTVADVLATPLPDCGLLRDETTIAGTVTLRCIEDWAELPVVAAAEGRVVNVVREPVVELVGVQADSGTWSWDEQTRLGAHVVIDHGPIVGTSNTQTVYAGLESIEDGIRVGATVFAGQPIASIAGPQPALQFSVWIDDQRQDGARTQDAGPDIATQRAVATALRDVIASPIDDRCPLVLNAGSLPGASRDYRNGTHRGIDFGCGAAERDIFSIADGTVVYLVDDYADPAVPERESLLAQAGIAGFTPHWTLVMLYGNVVVVDHGEIPGAGRVVTISAHLENVDPAITLGSTVSRGQRIGEAGNRGTNASALGIRGGADPTLHLHWELFVDNWYLGSGLNTTDTVEVITTALCGAAGTAGCPG